MKNIFLIFIFIVSVGIPQELDEDITLEKKWLMILPASQVKYGPVADKVTSIIADAATSVGRFEVIDRNLVDEILEEQAFQMSGIVSDEQVVEFGEMAAAEEALIINIVHFGQKGVPKVKKDENEKKDQDDEKDETLFSWVVKKTVTAAVDNTKSAKEKRRLELENNIHTVINANVRLVNMETGISEQSFKLHANYTGGNRDASLEQALSNLAFQVRSKLKELYIITSEVMEVDGKTISILSGENLGLEKGDFFEIASKDKQKTYKGKTVTLPGKSRGLAVITDVGPDASKARIIRKWRKVKEGHKAYEMFTIPRVADVSASYNNSPQYDLACKYWINPFSKLSVSINGYLGMITDSRKDSDFYAGIGTDLDFSIMSEFGTVTSTSLEFPVLFISRIDDDNHWVSTISVSPSININLSLQISKNRDLVFSAKKGVATNKVKWSYSKKTGEKDENGYDETEQVEAFWNGDGPLFDSKGIIFSISLRQFWF